MKTKNSTIATLLNVIPGVGYLYLGRRRVLAALLLVSMVLGFISGFDPSYMDYVNNAEVSVWDLASLLGFVSVEIGFMYDAYREAQQMQGKKLSSAARKRKNDKS